MLQDDIGNIIGLCMVIEVAKHQGLGGKSQLMHDISRQHEQHGGLNRQNEAQELWGPASLASQADIRNLEGC